jgi:hypothetical protein
VRHFDVGIRATTSPEDEKKKWKACQQTLKKLTLERLC